MEAATPVPAENTEPPVFTAENLPPAEAFSTFIKTAPTQMLRMEGPFKTVAKVFGKGDQGQDLEKEQECADGFLAIDANGQPYCLDLDIQEATYRPDETQPTTDHLEALRAQHGSELAVVVTLDGVPADRVEDAFSQLNAQARVIGFSVRDRRSK